MFKKAIVHYLCVAAIALSAALSSCNKDNDEYIISGVITGEHASWSELSVSFDFRRSWAATTKITDGKFKIKLPTPGADILETFDVEYPEVANISDHRAKGAVATFWARNGSEAEMLGLISVQIFPPAIVAANYLYADRKVNVEGAFEDTEGAMPVSATVDLKLNKGWNTVVTAIETTPGALKTSSKTAPAPSGSIWVAFSL